MAPKAQKSPAFQFYPKDWDTDINVIPMTYEEEGVYWALCRMTWLQGSLPADLDVLRCLLKGRPSLKRMQKWWIAIGRCFQEVDGRLHHPRLNREREKQVQNQAEGRSGGQAKWGGETNPNKETRRERLQKARERGTHTELEWAEVLAAYKRCLRCGATGVELVKDHIVPLYQDGDDSIRNLQPLCRRCNAAKGPESTDWRVGQPETRPEWLPSRTSTLTPSDIKPSIAFPSSSSPAGGAGTPPRQGVQGAGAFGAGTLPRDHVRHGYCGPGYRLCLNQWEFTELAKQFGGNDPAAARTAIEGFVDALVKALGDNQSPGGFKAIEQEFQVYLRRIGRLTAGPRLDAVAAVGETAHDQKIRDMRAGKFNG